MWRRMRYVRVCIRWALIDFFDVFTSSPFQPGMMEYRRLKCFATCLSQAGLAKSVWYIGHALIYASFGWPVNVKLAWALLHSNITTLSNTQWLNDCQLIERLVERLSPEADPDEHSSADSILCEISASCRDAASEAQQVTNPLLQTLERWARSFVLALSSSCHVEILSLVIHRVWNNMCIA